MAGLVKPKKYDWKDSNLALFGSDLERNVKKAAAETEPAWKEAGKKVGLQIWRIVKFNVKSWPKNQYGQFFNGDSYIILNTYKNEGEDELLYDVHYWIGQYSTADEYGTAAYKTVELDTLLDDKPIQYREVMGHESDLFRTYFSEITLLEGGADSGFYHVKPEEYKPRLLHFHGVKKSIEVRERPLSKKALDDTDVFILDLGQKIYQWNGDGANKDERFKASQYLQKLRSDRGKCETEVFVGEDLEWLKLVEKYLPDVDLDDDDDGADDDFEPSIFRLSDETGEMKFTKEAKYARSSLDTKDAFIVDTGKACFVWIGKETTQSEKRQAMSYAHDYLKRTQHPLVSVSRVVEGKETASFKAALP
ncbi:PREDICTED: gelsolin-like protein 2 [Amphimedon queenslandica]|uniref:Gelsolin-like domain-containing protein n=1 Tax=Amphimedon queenslandica TaxID=400682 RepID=A0A1X7U713_AMPQE|nr:PREDICTED: gelsolin-like protein 2 [Amphimedon queenslandica]|eukprot:XP_011405971.1 PREDICTED: gelsolin-like protein 2 [Amphimedon queenslandica]